MGMGFAMPQQMSQSMNQNQNQEKQQDGPPPLPGFTPYHVAVGGSQQGPFNLEKLKEMALSGSLTKESLVWKPGMAAWTKAGEIAELKVVFDSAPPPLP